MIKERELVTLAVLTEYDTPYVLYAHAENALAAGLSREQIQQAVHGKVPGGLDEQEAMVQLRRPMQDEEYDEAVGILGRERIAGLVHIASLYIYAVMLTNIGSDGDVPPTKEGSFIATKNPALGEWVSWGRMLHTDKAACMSLLPYVGDTSLLAYVRVNITPKIEITSLVSCLGLLPVLS